MSPATFLDSIHRPLALLARENGGRLDVASDPDHVIEILAAASPRGWRLILSYAGDEAAADDRAGGIVKLRINCTVQAARGLAAASGASVHATTQAGREPLLALAALVSRWVRGLSGAHPDLPCDGLRQMSSSWLVIEGLPTHQINTVFEIHLALDKPIDVPVQFPASS